MIGGKKKIMGGKIKHFLQQFTYKKSNLRSIYITQQQITVFTESGIKANKKKKPKPAHADANSPDEA